MAGDFGAALAGDLDAAFRSSFFSSSFFCGVEDLEARGDTHRRDLAAGLAGDLAAGLVGDFCRPLTSAVAAERFARPCEPRSKSLDLDANPALAPGDVRPPEGDLDSAEALAPRKGAAPTASQVRRSGAQHHR